ncbi:pentatricopeptide repeat-containing protein At2g15980 [Macadamia integrifolia]|uniref:pentatricopeptide repeat-containing protein At2g15980 n=1 Tax=Macadamia integrifolia TaxID=60698 RepID=UPI001C4F1E70|nr:pentatricopeptide repeat-containing protein At2g15980 [Macadamia integrifolia]
MEILKRHRSLSVSSCRHFAVNFSLSFHSLPSSPSDQNPPNETLISSVVSILKEQRSKSRWNFIKSLYPDGFSPREVSQIILHIRNNPRLALRFFLWSERSICTHDLLSYSTIIHILARARLKTQAQSLIQTAIRVSEVDNFDDPEISSKPPKIFETLVKTYRSCDSAPFVFDLLIRACLQARKIDRATAIVWLLRSRGIYPTISTCNLLIRSVSQLKGCDAGYAFYREIFGFDDEIRGKLKVTVRPNVQTFNTLMLSFYQGGMTEKVQELWVEMVEFNCSPNVFSYSALMAAFCDEGKMTEALALKLWEEMRTKQIDPDVTAYNTLIGGFCKIGQTERAEQIFRDMGLNEIEATCLTYEHLIKGYCEIGDINSSVLLYKDMCRKDFRPEASTIDKVVQVMCCGGRVNEGLNFLRNAMKRQDFFPGIKSYELLIRELCKEGEMEEALQLQLEMVGKGFQPNSEIYGFFIEGYKEQGNEEKARDLMKEMVEIGLQRQLD